MMRLDQILLEESQTTIEQINEALEYQQIYGGRLENHLYRLGYLDEEALLISLSKQFHCKYICLSDLKLADDVLAMIPPEVAWHGLLLPFEYDRKLNLIKIACENPGDKDILEDLEEFYEDIKVELSLALGSVLKCKIVDYYRNTMADFYCEQYSNELNGRDKESQIIKSNENNDKNTGAKPEYDFYSIIYNDDPERDYSALTDNLRLQGIPSDMVGDIKQLADLFNLRKPDVLILAKNGDGTEILNFIANLDSAGINSDQTISYLINENLDRDEAVAVLELGLEDIFHAGNILDLLVLKIGRIKERAAFHKEERVQLIKDLGTHGLLKDMNVIDLIQMLGPTRKTVRMDITAKGCQLLIFLRKGNIIFAECGDISGVEAVFKGIHWNVGIWSILPVKEEELPEPNNELSNDAIMLEGCRIYDELTLVQ